MVDATTIYFPGNLAGADTLAGLRAVPSAPLLTDAAFLVRGGVSEGDGQGGVFTWVPGSLEVDNNSSVIRPSDLTPLQAGRWIKIDGQSSGGDSFSFITANGMEIPASLTLLQTSSYETAGDGGQALFARRQAMEVIGPFANTFTDSAGFRWEQLPEDGHIFRMQTFGVKSYCNAGSVTGTAGQVTENTNRAKRTMRHVAWMWQNGRGRYTVQLPPFAIAIDDALPAFNRADDGSMRQIQMTIQGSGRNYGPDNGSAIYMSNGNVPAFFVCGARGVKFKDFGIFGPNGVYGFRYTPSADELLRRKVGVEAQPWWNRGGVMRDQRYSPCGGIVIEPFGNAPPDSGGYPGYADHYGAPSYLVSSGVSVENVYFECLIVGVANGISVNLQNCDDVHITDCRWNRVKVCAAYGTSQTRGCTVTRPMVQYADTAIDCATYGSGGGAFPTVDKATFVSIRDLGKSHSDNPVMFTNTYAEQCWRLGSYQLSTGYWTVSFLQNQLIRLMDPEIQFGSGKTVDCHVDVNGPLIMTGGFCGTYSGAGANKQQSLSLRITQTLSMKDMAVENPPVVCDANSAGFKSSIEYENMGLRLEGVGGAIGMRHRHRGNLLNMSIYGSLHAQQGTIIDGSQSGLNSRRYIVGNDVQVLSLEASTAVVVDETTGTFTFTASDPARYAVNEQLTSSTAWMGEAYDGTLTLGMAGSVIGRVVSIVGSVITCCNAPYHFSSGNYQIGVTRYPIVQPECLATTTAGSTAVTITAGTPSLAYAANQRISGITGPGVAVMIAGNVIESRTGNNIVLKKAATVTATNVLLYDAELMIESAYSDAIPTEMSVQGRFVRNRREGAADANNMSIEGWLATANASPGTWEPRYRSKVSPAT